MTSTIAPPEEAALPRRYHPAQVSLHWLIAILVLITPLLASEGEGETGGLSGGPGGIPTIGFHMLFGIAILVLLVVRVFVRWAIRRPQWATTGSALLDRIGQWTHIGLYFFTFAVTVTGLIFALQTNRLAAVFGRAPNGQSAPGISQPGQPPSPGIRPGAEGGEGSEGFEGGFGGGLQAVGRFVFRAFHELSWKILLALIILHVAAALYHQFIRKDNLLGRMWFGSST
jgi:cytochrome b561